MAIHESGEDYLETILVLQNKTGSVRSIDVANELGYTKASISRAMSILKEEEYIVIGKSGSIIFTEKGLQKADEVLNRHKIIAEFLVKTLGVDTDLADKNACRIEHVISHEVFDKMMDFVRKQGSTDNSN
jgi:Mn-dependent DtxR family transcriptional regulator